MVIKSLYYKKLILVLLILISSGCSGISDELSSTSTPTGTFTPSPATQTPTYTPDFTATPDPTNTPVILVSPTPTETPVIHEVRSGETFIGIANQYDISVENLTLANPSVNPSLMPIGITLTIPISTETTIQLPISTLDLEMLEMDCFNEPLGPTWCLAAIINKHSNSYVNVSASLSTLDVEGNLIQTVPVSTPILYFPAGSVMPFGFYFPNGKADDVQFSLNITTGTEISPEIENDLWQELSSEELIIEESSTSIEIGISIEEIPQNSYQIYTIGYVLDENGTITGYRIKQQDVSDLTGPFTDTIKINSLDPEINSYELYTFIRLRAD